MTIDALGLREELAALCHQQWSDWMGYLFSRCIRTSMRSLGPEPQPQRGVQLCTIPEEWYLRWLRQSDTPYAELSEAEKDSDRKEADRILELVLAEKAQPSDVRIARLLEQLHKGGLAVPGGVTFREHVRTLAALCRDAAEALAAAQATITALSQPIEISDELHRILEAHGVASRTDGIRLATELVSWAARSCRQTTAKLEAQVTALSQENQQLQAEVEQWRGSYRMVVRGARALLLQTAADFNGEIVVRAMLKDDE